MLITVKNGKHQKRVLAAKEIIEKLLVFPDSYEIKITPDNSGALLYFISIIICPLALSLIIILLSSLKKCVMIVD
ncbi:hypothetical protein EG346_14880 [Chryseobacterium carnipullorum]|uniref:Uncharacterized protein n=1 Tax=Chryseobacterium carnipullorum TaxID=1124835 RepID=A0A3G6M1D1_CHRCU|nr:hypothetical protein EG346_14880 [Chryseobacterium carnipullorum]AZA64270.1 hypothetical protein EG345_05815 [Chryseobacterium carnipullorum]